jgi:CBS domain-containing protein
VSRIRLAVSLPEDRLMILNNAPISDFMSTIRWTASPTDSVAEAGRNMKEHGVHHLPVLDDGKLVGIVSALDVLRIDVDDREKAPVSSVMTPDVETIASNATVREVLDLIERVTFNAFPVVDGEVLVGIVTTADLEELLYRDF